MAPPRPLLAVAALLLICSTITFASPIKNTYIIHMAKAQMPATFTEHTTWYSDSLTAVSPAAEVIYTYNTVAHGFAARLTAAEARTLSHRAGVLAVNKEAIYTLHTTRTPEFLGLNDVAGLLPQSSTAADVVVGVLDTGAWPHHPSYSDAGLGPVPASWSGACESSATFNASACNRKLVGARFFCRGYEAGMGPVDETRESRSPRDDDGHGTHTSTTAAGTAVPSANLLGYAAGTARGMSTGARVAAYKVCWAGGCVSSDILAAMDKAVEDGCGVLSLSLGGGSTDYWRDSVAIGAFNAMKQGVLVACSAGNAGPGAATLSNVAPWITTVGAGTLDRDFPAYVSLGDGHNFTGVSLYSGKPLSGAQLPFVYAGNASNATSGNLCMTGTLIPELVAGKVVLCDRGVNARVQKGLVVRDAGGAGMVLANAAGNGEELVADAHLLPAAGVGEKAGDALKSYLQTSSNPTATIMFGGTKVGVRPSPVVAAFSSRGPNIVTPDILKPDLIAPGVNILAGWTGAVGPTGMAADTRRVEFNIISGTSMSCPHVSGLAALLKAARPEWSPAAVRSALMTTSYAKYAAGGGILDVATGLPATPFDMGAGYVDPKKALDPGLVYDLGAADYLDFLCALNYTALQIGALAGSRNFTCSSGKSYAVAALNYPSFSVTFATANGEGGGEEGASTVTHLRTLTNVGMPGTYKAETTLSSTSSTVKVAVEPTELKFTKQGEKLSYKVSFSSVSQPSGSLEFGRLEWSDGEHVVASPVAFSWT